MELSLLRSSASATSFSINSNTNSLTRATVLFFASLLLLHHQSSTYGFFQNPPQAKMQFLSIIIASIATAAAAQGTQGGVCPSGTYQCSTSVFHLWSV